MMNNPRLFECGATFHLPAIPRLTALKCHPQLDRLEELDNEWVREFLPFKSDNETERFLACQHPLWVALTYPTATLDRLLEICEITSFLFALDDACYSDPLGPDGLRMRRELSEIGPMMGGARFSEDLPFVRALHDVWRRMKTKMPILQQRRFMAAAADFRDGCRKEIEARSRGEILSFEAYLKVRREGALGGGVYLIFAEYAAGVDLTNDIVDDEDLREINRLATDHWLLSNDLFSFRREYYAGDYMNAVLVLMHSERHTLQAAVERVCALLEATEREFVERRDRILSQELDHRSDMRKYLKSLEYVVSGNLEHSRFAVRYHGPGHTENPLRCGTVTLLSDRTVYVPMM
jgi:hypothetical protein